MRSFQIVLFSSGGGLAKNHNSSVCEQMELERRDVGLQPLLGIRAFQRYHRRRLHGIYGYHISTWVCTWDRDLSKQLFFQIMIMKMLLYSIIFIHSFTKVSQPHSFTSPLATASVRNQKITNILFVWSVWGEILTNFTDISNVIQKPFSLNMEAQKWTIYQGVHTEENYCEKL